MARLNDLACVLIFLHSLLFSLTLSAIAQPKDYIDYPVALLVYPSQAEIEALQQRMGDEYFDVADDGLYYMGQAIAYLNGKEMDVEDTVASDIRFLKQNGLIEAVVKGDLVWAIILYKPGKDPLVIAPIDILFEYQQYFGPE